MKIAHHVQSFYPTRQPTIFYTADDPDIVARGYLDRHLLDGLSTACQLLSAVWHREEDAQIVVASRSSTLPGWSKPVDLSASLRGLAIFPTMSSWPANQEHIHWARDLGGNYDWVWRFGMALIDETTYRWGMKESEVLKAFRSMLLNLEVLPRRLEPTRFEFYDAPYNLDPLFQGGDSAESFQHFIALGQRGVHGWTKRPTPKFVTTIWENHPHLHIAV